MNYINEVFFFIFQKKKKIMCLVVVVDSKCHVNQKKNPSQFRKGF